VRSERLKSHGELTRDVTEWRHTGVIEEVYEEVDPMRDLSRRGHRIHTLRRGQGSGMGLRRRS